MQLRTDIFITRSCTFDHMLHQKGPFQFELHSREVEEEGGDGEEQRPRERRGQELCLVLAAARHLIGLVKSGRSSPED